MEVFCFSISLWCPEGLEIVALMGTTLIVVALVPYGIKTIAKEEDYKMQTGQ
jgi:hypothetical protein